MSFSSAQWTVPELCVWIVTRSREAINALPPKVKASLRYAEMVHPGAYAARDEVVEAAQADVIRITCAGQRNFHGTVSPRRTLTADFWKNAEIEDRGHWQSPGSYWCVAKRVDGSGNASEFSDLLVDSVQVKERWTSEAAPKGTARAADVEQNPEGGPVTPRRSGRQTTKATQAEHDEWMKARVKKLITAGLQSNTPEDEEAAKAEPPEGLGIRSVRERVREARRVHAPSKWQKTDVRRQK